MYLENVNLFINVNLFTYSASSAVFSNFKTKFPLQKTYWNTIFHKLLADLFSKTFFDLQEK